MRCCRTAHVADRATDAAGSEVAVQVTTARGARGTAVVNPDGSFSFRTKVQTDPRTQTQRTGVLWMRCGWSDELRDHAQEWVTEHQHAAQESASSRSCWPCNWGPEVPDEVRGSSEGGSLSHHCRALPTMLTLGSDAPLVRPATG